MNTTEIRCIKSALQHERAFCGRPAVGPLPYVSTDHALIAHERGTAHPLCPECLARVTELLTKAPRHG